MFILLHNVQLRVVQCIIQVLFISVDLMALAVQVAGRNMEIGAQQQKIAAPKFRLALLIRVVAGTGLAAIQAVMLGPILVQALKIVYITQRLASVVQ